MKTTTPSFILELPLDTNPVQESTRLVRLEIQSQSGSLVKSATIISEAMDDVILQIKDESHREFI